MAFGHPDNTRTRGVVRVRERAWARTHRKLITSDRVRFYRNLLSLRSAALRGPDNKLSGPPKTGVHYK